MAQVVSALPLSGGGAQRFIRRSEVVRRTGLSAGTIYLLERRGEFPSHFLVTPRCACWDEADVDAWLAARKAASRGKAASTAKVGAAP